jgi:hypothetical protein
MLVMSPPPLHVCRGIKGHGFKSSLMINLFVELGYDLISKEFLLINKDLVGSKHPVLWYCRKS